MQQGESGQVGAALPQQRAAREVLCIHLSLLARIGGLAGAD
jgi:hypothetical protein